MEGLRGSLSGAVLRCAPPLAAALAAVALLFALLAGAPGAAAAPKKITGKLTRPGLDVMALAKSGEASSKRTKANGKFRLRPPARNVTLHLRAADGTYAGPVVVGKRKKGRRAILGVKSGAKLGKVKIKPAKGFAKVKRRLPARRVDAKRKARAKRGVTIGAGNFGRVRSKTKRGAPGDLDGDGIPDPLDIDDDGDLVLDELERPTAARGASARTRGASALTRAASALTEFGVSSELPLGSHGANANAPGLSDQQVEEFLPRFGRLLIDAVDGDPGTTSELDCGTDDPATPEREGLIYCSPGGTGRVWDPEVGLEYDDRSSLDGRGHPAFPGDPFGPFDPDGDGFGSVPGPLFHGVTTAAIGTGDVMIQRVTLGGEEQQFPGSVQFVFATVPALVSYDDGAGNSETIPYPFEPAPGDPGNMPVADSPDDADSDVEVVLTFWRPQRRPIGEGPDKEACLSNDPPCKWVDIGGLHYGANVQFVGPPPGEEGSGRPGPPCPQGTFSGLDPQLAFGEGPNFTQLADTALDAPADPQNTFAYTLNLSQCLASAGISWQSGQAIGVQFLASAADSASNASQNIAFVRE